MRIERFARVAVMALLAVMGCGPGVTRSLGAHDSSTVDGPDAGTDETARDHQGASEKPEGGGSDALDVRDAEASSPDAGGGGDALDVRDAEAGTPDGDGGGDALDVRDAEAGAPDGDGGGDALDVRDAEAGAPDGDGWGDVAADIGDAPSPSVLTASDVVGTWFLVGNGTRQSVTISGTGPLTATLINEEGNLEPLDKVTVEGGFLEYRRVGQGFVQWYRLTVNHGVVVGRFSHTTAPSKPELTTFYYTVTGWRDESFREPPLAWELVLNGTFLARLRIDLDGAGHLVGELKVYATSAGGAADEEPQFALTNVIFDGTHLSFSRGTAGHVQVFTGTTIGRTISGTFTDEGEPAGSSFPWTGTRAEVLSYGIGRRRSPVDSANRLETLRSRLATLMMAGNPAPHASTTSLIPAQVQPMPTVPPGRDDDVAHHEQAYTLKEWTMAVALTHSFDGSEATRPLHGFIARPTTAPPSGGFPIVVALNGHGGSAFAVMNPSNAAFWYGDAYARRGFLVVSVDISHRPPADSTLHTDPLNGDDPSHANGAHASIKDSTGNTNWEEDGERAWDVMRAVDLALAQPNVDAGHVLVTGLSLGGEVATIAAAMDPRIGMAVVAGYSPDMGVELLNGNHRCFAWALADIREYVDVADFEALIAPRPLVVETGAIDTTFSAKAPPFGGDKQVLRRAAAAFQDQGALGKLVHYLHDGQHQYRFGDRRPGDAEGLGVQGAAIGPPSPASSDWQRDATTTRVATSVFSLIQNLFP